MGLEAINILRKQKGMSLDELAEKSGIPIGTLSKINAGITKDPKLETVKSIARALGCSLEEFDDYQTDKLLSNEEKEILAKYRTLDDNRKLAVLNCLNFEYQQGSNKERE